MIRLTPLQPGLQTAYKYCVSKNRVTHSQPFSDTTPLARGQRPLVVVCVLALGQHVTSDRPVINHTQTAGVINTS